MHISFKKFIAAGLALPLSAAFAFKVAIPVSGQKTVTQANADEYLSYAMLRAATFWKTYQKDSKIQFAYFDFEGGVDWAKLDKFIAKEKPDVVVLPFTSKTLAPYFAKESTYKKAPVFMVPYANELSTLGDRLPKRAIFLNTSVDQLIAKGSVGFQTDLDCKSTTYLLSNSDAVKARVENLQKDLAIKASKTVSCKMASFDEDTATPSQLARATSKKKGGNSCYVFWGGGSDAKACVAEIEKNGAGRSKNRRFVYVDSEPFIDGGDPLSLSNEELKTGRHYMLQLHKFSKDSKMAALSKTYTETLTPKAKTDLRFAPAGFIKTEVLALEALKLSDYFSKNVAIENEFMTGTASPQVSMEWDEVRWSRDTPFPLRRVTLSRLDAGENSPVSIIDNF